MNNLKKNSRIKLVYNYFFRPNNPIVNGIHPKLGQLLAVSGYTSHFDIDPIMNPIKQDNVGESWYEHMRSWDFLMYYQYFYRNTGIVSANEVEMDSDNIYLYPIEVNSNPSTLTETYHLKFNNEDIYYKLVDTIPDTIMSFLRSGRVKLCLNSLNEPILGSDDLKQVEQMMKDLGVDSKNIIYLSGNNFQKYKEDYNDSRILLSSGDFILRKYSSSINRFPLELDLGYISDIVRESNLDYLKVRSKRFLSYNRTMAKRHRLGLLYFLYKHNLLSQGYFSFLNLGDFDVRGHIQELLSDNDKDLDWDRIIRELLPIELDTVSLSAEQMQGFNVINNDKELYLDSYFHIVTETWFEQGDPKNPFLSEKIWKPIANLQPFIILGNSYSLKKIRDLGFKTFHPFINEKYDLQLNYQARLYLTFGEIYKLSQMPIEKLHDYYHSITDILIYNQNHLKTFEEMNPFDKALTDIENYYGTSQ